MAIAGQPQTERKAVIRTQYGVWKPIYSKVVQYDHANLPDNIIQAKCKLSHFALLEIRSKPEYGVRLARMHDRVETSVVEKLAKEEVDYITQAKAILTKATVQAAKYVVKVYKKGSAKERIRLDAALQILDRCNIKGKEVIETQTRPLSPEELLSAKSTLLELETITQRVSQTHSRFVLSAKSSETDKGSHDQSPIEAQSHSSPLDEAEPAGQDRPDPEPTQPILPV